MIHWLLRIYHLSWCLRHASSRGSGKNDLFFYHFHEWQRHVCRLSKAEYWRLYYQYDNNLYE